MRSDRSIGLWIRGAVLSVAGLVGLAGFSPAVADEPAPTPTPSGPQVRPPAALRVLKGFDESLARTTHLGIYLRRQRVGAFKSVLGRALPKSGATYLETSTLELQVGGTGYAQSVRIWMAADFSLVRKETLETTTQGEKTQHRRSTLEIKEGEWVLTRLQGLDEEGTRSALRTPAAGPNYGPCLTAAAAKLASSTQDGAPATYRLPAILWAGRQREETSAAALTLSITPPREVEHRGRKLQAVHARITGKGEPLDLLFTPSGLLLSMSGAGIPYRFVQGSPEEIPADLPAPRGAAGPAAAGPVAAPGATTPRQAVEVFLLALARVKPADALDSVVDFEAVLARIRAADPQAPKVSAKELATLFKTRIERGGGPLTKELAKQELSKLKVKLKGEVATARIPQHKEPFHLERKAGRWWIVSWPAK